MWSSRAIAFLALAALAACSDVPRPFQEARDPDNALLVLSDPAGIVVDDVADLPESAQQKFKAALVEQLHKAEVPATLGQGNAQSFHLKGQVLEFQQGAQTEVQVYWLLVNAQGESLGNHVVRREVDTKSWKEGNQTLLGQIARDSSAGIAGLLPDRRQQVAAAPRTRLEPPPGKIVNNIVPPMGTGLGRTVKKDADRKPRERQQVAQLPQAKSNEAKSNEAKPDAAKPATPSPAAPSNAVALRPVEGAPGDGREALERAMRHYLGRASIPVVEEREDPSAIVAGKVVMRDAGARQQEIQVEWSVYAPDGKRLGTIGQANKIPAGKLDGRWGDVAFAVAENAVQGLGELFEQLDGLPPASPAAVLTTTPAAGKAPTPK